MKGAFGKSDKAVIRDEKPRRLIISNFLQNTSPSLQTVGCLVLTADQLLKVFLLIEPPWSWSAWLFGNFSKMGGGHPVPQLIVQSTYWKRKSIGKQRNKIKRKYPKYQYKGRVWENSYFCPESNRYIRWKTDPEGTSMAHLGIVYIYE